MFKRKFIIFIFVFVTINIFTAGDIFASKTTDRPEYVVVIVLDGCRPEYLKLAPLPHFQELMKKGITYDMAWVGQLPTLTPSVHATLGTGVFPSHHHVVSFNWKDPIAGTMIYPARMEYLRSGSLLDVIEKSGAPSLFGIYKEFYPKGRTLAIGSIKPYAAVPLGNYGADYIVYTPRDKQSTVYGKKLIKPGEIRQFETHPGHELDKEVLNQINREITPFKDFRDFDTWVVDAFLTVFEQKKPTFSMMNLPGTDETGHEHGISPEYMKPIITNVDEQLGRIIDAFKKAGIFDRTLFVITADHGMVPITYNISIGSYIAAFWQPKFWPRSDIKTPYIWLRASNEARNVAQRIHEIKPAGIDHIFYKVSKNEETFYQPVSAIKPSILKETYQYLLKTLASSNSSDLWLFIKENTGFGRFPLNRGTHYHPTWNAQHIPLIISGPGVRSNIHSDMPARIVDIPPTILNIMGIEPKNMDGIVLTDALSAPLPEQVKVQKQLSETLISYQRALIAQAQSDLRALDNMPKSPSFFYRYWLWFLDALFLLSLFAGLLGVKKAVSHPVLKKVILTVFIMALVVSQIVFFLGMIKLLEI